MIKHASEHSGDELNTEKQLAEFADDVNDHALFIGWYDYMEAVGTMPLEAQVFQLWYFSKYPERLNPQRKDDIELAFFGADLRTIPRAEQKKRMQVAIEKYRKVPELINDPHTDARQLMLGPI